MLSRNSVVFAVVDKSTVQNAPGRAERRAGTYLKLGDEADAISVQSFHILFHVRVIIPQLQ